MTAIIELDAVGKNYGSVRALDSLSAELSGQVIGLLGPNGAGKSTLLKALLGLTSHEGSAKVLGLSTADQSFAIRDRVGYMPELDSYLEGLTAVELCSYAAELSGLPRNEAMQRAHAALYYAGLEDKRYLKVEGYSTGLKQRVKLAQALVHDPELLFLDEPTNGLDPRARDEMLDLIVELPQKRDCSVIISTHLLPDVDRICDQVVIMQSGQLRFSGSIQSLRESGAGMDESRVDVEVRDDRESFAEFLRGLDCQVEDNVPHGLCVDMPKGQNALFLFAAAKESGHQIRHYQVRLESLEEAFIRVIGEAPKELEADAKDKGSRDE